MGEQRELKRPKDFTDYFNSLPRATVFTTMPTSEDTNSQALTRIFQALAATMPPDDTEWQVLVTRACQAVQSNVGSIARIEQRTEEQFAETMRSIEGFNSQLQELSGSLGRINDEQVSCLHGCSYFEFFNYLISPVRLAEYTS